MLSSSSSSSSFQGNVEQNEIKRLNEITEELENNAETDAAVHQNLNLLFNIDCSLTTIRYYFFQRIQQIELKYDNFTRTFQNGMQSSNLSDRATLKSVRTALI